MTELIEGFVVISKIFEGPGALHSSIHQSQFFESANDAHNLLKKKEREDHFATKPNKRMVAEALFDSERQKTYVDIGQFK